MAIELLPQLERLLVNDILSEGFAAQIQKEQGALEVSPLQKLAYLQAVALSESDVNSFQVQVLNEIFKTRQDALFVYLAAHRFETDVDTISLDVYLNGEFILRTSVTNDFGPQGPHFPQWTSVVDKTTSSEYDLFVSDIGLIEEADIEGISGCLYNGIEDDYQHKVQIKFSSL